MTGARERGKERPPEGLSWGARAAHPESKVLSPPITSPDLQRGIFESFQRRRRVFAPSSAAFVHSGRALAGVAAEEGWQTLDDNPSFLSDALIAASCREQGITLITKDGDFKRLSPFVKGFHYAAPWPTATAAPR